MARRIIEHLFYFVKRHDLVTDAAKTPALA
jgi:hypothetical protein